MAALGRLARLVEYRNSAEAPQPRRPWTLLALGASTLLIASVLLFARVPETEIELEIGATEVSFSLPSQQVLFENMSLTSLGVSGLGRVILPELGDGQPVETGAPLASDSADEDAAVRMEALEQGGRTGTIGIAAIVPGAGTDVSLRRADQPGQYRLSLRNAKGPIQVDVAGPLRIAAAGSPARTVDVMSPRAIVLEPGSGVVDLDLTFVDLAGAAMTPQVPIEKLALRRVDEFGDRGLSIVRTISTIVSGTLFFESLNGLPRPVRSGEALRFGVLPRDANGAPGSAPLNYELQRPGRRHENRVRREPAEPHADVAGLAARQARLVTALGDHCVSVRNRPRRR